jgi:hypothetical protein
MFKNLNLQVVRALITLAIMALGVAMADPGTTIGPIGR